MTAVEGEGKRAAQVAAVLRPLGQGPLTRDQAVAAANLLGVHWTTVYRLRRRFLADPVMSSMSGRSRGPKPGDRRLDVAIDHIINDVIRDWLPKQRQLAHPSTDLVLEVRRRCALAQLALPSRNTVARRWAEQREIDAMKRAALPQALVAPGTFVVKNALDIVQVDHTQADLFVVDELERKVVGRPWLSIALDVATRCVLSFYVSMERPGAATVGLLLTRAVLSKTPWLAKIGVDAQWPMHGVPKVLHLDNAAEFKSKALRSGCREYGIDLMYRPVGRPHFGGHIERLNRTLMERIRGLPGATGSSPKGRKARKSEMTAALTLGEFERWLAMEVARRYHESPHRGLLGATPADTWRALGEGLDRRRLPAAHDAELQFLIRFLPVEQRTIQADGLTLFHIRYWHPVFVAWREAGRMVTVRYHPEDLSRVFVKAGSKEYVEVRYADLRRPAIALFEQRRALKAIREAGQHGVSEAQIFRTVEDQRRVIVKARRATLSSRRRSRSRNVPCVEILDRLAESGSTPQPLDQENETINYDSPVEAYDVEQW